VKKQIAAVILNVCRQYASDLFTNFDYIYSNCTKFIDSSATKNMEKSILIQALIFCSNEFPTFEMQSNFIAQYIKPIYEYFTNQNFTNALQNGHTFGQFMGLLSTNPNPLDLSNKKQIHYSITVLYGILKSIKFKTIDNDEQAKENLKLNGFIDPTTGHVKSPGFLICYQVFDYIIEMFKCFNMLHSIKDNDSLKSYLEMTEQVKLAVLGINTNNTNVDLTVETNEETSKNRLTIYNIFETTAQVIGAFLSKYKNEILLVQMNDQNYALIQRLGTAIFASFDDLPDFRKRSIVRYILKACLDRQIDNDRELIENNMLTVKLNELLLEYFLPTILNHITEKNKLYNDASHHQQQQQQQNGFNLHQQQQQQSDKERDDLVSEAEFTLFRREVVDIVRQFISGRQLIPPNSNANSGSNEPNSNDFDGGNNENDLNNIYNSNKLSTNVSADQNNSAINDMAAFILNRNQTIYESIVLFIFQGLYWQGN
jgi:hypothetical protein